MVGNEKLSSPSELISENMLGWMSPSLGYGRLCPHNKNRDFFISPIKIITKEDKCWSCIINYLTRTLKSSGLHETHKFGTLL